MLAHNGQSNQHFMIRIKNSINQNITFMIKLPTSIVLL